MRAITHQGNDQLSLQVRDERDTNLGNFVGDGEELWETPDFDI